jgi:HTH-type transcriptional regulator/antitoxin HigA
VLSKEWEKPGDVTKDFNTARTSRNNMAIFEINHNDYRLIAGLNYQKGWVFIKFIGTHAAYDKVDAATIDLFKTKKISKANYMQLKILKTKKDYLNALTRFEQIFQAKTDTKESQEADVLALLIKEYEDKNYLIHAPNPLEAIKYRMQQQGLTYNDLAQILGFKSRVTDLFNKHRKLNLSMVRKLHNKLNIPLETLVREY